MIRPSEICDADDISSLSEYPALPPPVFPLGTHRVTERQPAVRADKLPSEGAETGETEGRTVVVRTIGYSLLSDNIMLAPAATGCRGGGHPWK